MWSTHTSIIADTHLHYLRYAAHADKPPLVMLHGITDSGACFMRVAEALADEYDVVMVDLRGHGMSGAPKTGYSPEILAADVLGLIAALGLYRPVLIGHSIGAEVAALVAVDAPDLVQGVVMEDPPFRAQPLSDNKINATGNWWENLIRERRAKTLETLMDEGRRRQWHDLDLKHWAASKRQVTPAFVEYLTLQNQHDWRETLRHVVCPVLVLTGDATKRGAITTAAVAQDIETLLHDGRVIHVPGAGHNIRRDQFDIYISAVSLFLQTIKT